MPTEPDHDYRTLPDREERFALAKATDLPLLQRGDVVASELRVREGEVVVTGTRSLSRWIGGVSNFIGIMGGQFICKALLAAHVVSSFGVALFLGALVYVPIWLILWRLWRVANLPIPWSSVVAIDVVFGRARGTLTYRPAPSATSARLVEALRGAYGPITPAPITDAEGRTHSWNNVERTRR